MRSYKISFVKSPKEYICKEAFAVYIPAIRSKIELLSDLSISLKFPDYFGHNWDALCEMYRDFSWIDEWKIVVIHEDLSKLSFSDLNIYIEIVKIANNFWQIDNTHDVVFVFPENEKNKIMNILDK